MCYQEGLPSRATFKWETTFPVLLPYTTIGVTSNPCKVPLPLCISMTTRVRLIRLGAVNVLNGAMPLKRCALPSPICPILDKCLHVMLLARGQLSVMLSLSLHRLQMVLLLLLSSNRYSSRILILTYQIFPDGRTNHDDYARTLFQNALQANPELTCLSGMDEGISTTGLRVAGVPIGNNKQVQQIVQEKATAFQIDVGKLDIISDGLIHYQMLCFCQNTRVAFLGCNTPTPLISDILAQVDATILEVLCQKGTTSAHVEWTAVFRCFADMKFQLPHFRGRFGVTPNAGSAISAFYAASVSLVQWLGFYSHPEQNFIDFASTWGPGQDSANHDLWTAPILIALKQADQVLFTEFGCHEWILDGPAPAWAVLQIKGSSPNPAANAPQSAPRNVVPPLTLLPPHHAL